MLKSLPFFATILYFHFLVSYHVHLKDAVCASIVQNIQSIAFAFSEFLVPKSYLAIPKKNYSPAACNCQNLVRLFICLGSGPQPYFLDSHPPWIKLADTLTGEVSSLPFSEDLIFPICFSSNPTFPIRSLNTMPGLSNCFERSIGLPWAAPLKIIFNGNFSNINALRKRRSGASLQEEAYLQLSKLRENIRVVTGYSQGGSPK